jgi:hypothetical protein
MNLSILNSKSLPVPTPPHHKYVWLKFMILFSTKEPYLMSILCQQKLLQGLRINLSSIPLHATYILSLHQMGRHQPHGKNSSPIPTLLHWIFHSNSWNTLKFLQMQFLVRHFYTSSTYGPKYHATVVRKTQDHDAADNANVKTLFELGDGSCNEIIDYKTL